MTEHSDRLDTLQDSVPLQEIARRMLECPNRYAPSYIARIISRGIPEIYQRKVKGMRRGNIGILETDKAQETILRIEDLVTPFEYYPYKINYDTIIFPGTHYGKLIFAALDEKMRTLPPQPDLDHHLRIAAFLTIVAASAHAFPDVNGRVSVGLADVYLRAQCKKSLNMSALSNEDNVVELWTAMVNCTYLLLPEKYNPKAIIEESKRKNRNEIEVDAPYLGVFSFQEQALVRPFRPIFADSIIQFIRDFQGDRAVTNNQLDIYYHLDRLAGIYKECLQ